MGLFRKKRKPKRNYPEFGENFLDDFFDKPLKGKQKPLTKEDKRVFNIIGKEAPIKFKKAKAEFEVLEGVLKSEIKKLKKKKRRR